MKVPVNTPIFKGNEREYLMDCINSGWISSAGEYIKKFEQGIADFIGKKYSVAVSNGTVALEDAVNALHIDKGSEVIFRDFTIISCVQAIVKSGMVTVMVDCDRFTWNMNVSQVESHITNKTKAIMAVHIYGIPVDMDPILELAKKYNLLVIEDVAEAQGLLYKDRMCGSMGDISTLSFFPNKHIVCGEGGMILTNNESYFLRAKDIMNLFFDSERRYIHSEFGENHRMTNMQAAVGLAQLEQIKATVIRKREIGRRYQEELSGIELFQLPIAETSYAKNIYWVFGMVINDSSLNAVKVMRKLKDYGIDTRHFFYPMHKQPALIKSGCCSEENLDDNLYCNSNYISEYGFYIPSGIGMTYDEQSYVIQTIKKLFA